MNYALICSWSFLIVFGSLTFLLGQDYNNQNSNYVMATASEGIASSPLPPVGTPNPAPNNPFDTQQGAPVLVLQYNNTEYKGELRSAIFESGDVDRNMPSLAEDSANITAIIPNQTIDISENDLIKIAILNNTSSELLADSISVTAYYINGTVHEILSVKENAEQGIFIADLNPGEYLLLAVATWLPDQENYLTTSGYVTYVFRVNIL